MTSFDFARYSAKQARAHCEGNYRQIALDREGYQSQQRDALSSCDRLERQAHEEERAFRTWRSSFLVPRREAWGHFGAATDQAMARARNELERLRAVWAALAPLLSEDERTALLARDSS